MHIGKYVFAQITQFLPQRQFRRILAKYDDRTKGWTMSHWNHMLVLMFGQLIGCGTLRELTDITTAHGKKFKHLGFGDQPVNRQMLSKANLLRDHHIFEEFSFHMVDIAQLHIAIITYCLIAIIEHDLKIGRPVVEVMRILGKLALTTDNIRDLLRPLNQEAEYPDDGQLYFEFKLD